MEVIPTSLLQSHQQGYVLHVCGGDPQKFSQRNWLGECSPRMWRWSYAIYNTRYQARVFSTYVEVILNHMSAVTASYGVLHVCGGDPTQFIILAIKLACSPRMWRWSSTTCRLSQLHTVFSTYVEVILSSRLAVKLALGVLHVCGGDPTTDVVAKSSDLCSPRMWRWSPILRWKSCIRQVFSTYVEVILNHIFHCYCSFCVLHVCGGDPARKNVTCWWVQCSPRMWRWSFMHDLKENKAIVFSTYVEVILTLLELNIC